MLKIVKMCNLKTWGLHKSVLIIQHWARLATEGNLFGPNLDQALFEASNDFFIIIITETVIQKK